MANLRGWKRLAAGLLLVPALSALSLDAQAQTGSFAESSTKSVDTPTDAKTETKAVSPELELGKTLMKQAHSAYDKKDYVRAKDLCEQAKMLKVPASAWGDDRPDTLLTDIQTKTGIRKAETSMTKSAPPKTTTPSAPKKPVDPKVLVQDGRKALDAGKLDLAQDLGRQADATKPSKEWGLFEDSPSSLLKDVEKARVKKNKADSVRMLADSRTLVEKKAASNDERKTNLDKATDLALQAEKLHGPYNMFDMGDRPAKVLSDIDSEKAKLKTAMAKSAPPKGMDPKVGGSASTTSIAKSTSPKAMDPLVGGKSIDPKNMAQLPRLDDKKSDPKMVAQAPKSNSVQPTGGYNPVKMTPLPSLDPIPSEKVEKLEKIDIALKIEETRKKPELMPLMPLTPPGGDEQPIVVAKKDDESKKLGRDLMKEAKTLQAKGDYPGAKAKLLDASKYQLYFTADEESPQTAMVGLNIEAHQLLAKLCNDATDLAMKRDPASQAQAEKKLQAADDLAKGMGIDAQPVVTTRAMLASAKSPTTPSMMPIQEAMAMPQGPAAPMGLLPVGATVAEKPTISGQQMLTQARTELRSGDTDAARRHVEEVLASGGETHKKEAQALLRTIDNEEMLQRQRTAMKSLDAGVAAYNEKDYRQAFAIFQLIDDSMLPPNKKAQLKELKVACSASVKSANPTAVASKTPTDSGVVQAVNKDTPGAPSGVAQVGTELKGDADSMLKQQEALTEINFQKLRSEGLKIQSEAQAKFGKGDTDSAIEQLQGYLTRVKDAQLESARTALLSRPVENRLEQFKVMKKQQDVLTAEKKERNGLRKEMSQEMLAQQGKEQQVVKLMKEFSALMEAKKFEEAYASAQKAKQLDPDNPVSIAAVEVSRTAKRSEEFKKQKEAQEKYNYEEGANDLLVNAATAKNPLVLDPDGIRRANSRTNFSSGIGYVKPVSEREREIEKKMQGTISINFSNTPLPDAIDYFRTVTGIPISLDRGTIEADGRDVMKLMVSERLTDIKVKSALNVILKQLKLVTHLEDDVLKITTEKGVRGKLTQKIIPVADLIVPIQDFNPAAVNDLTTTLERGVAGSRPTINGISGSGGLGNVSPVTPALGLNAGSGTQVGSGLGGNLQTNPAGGMNVTKYGAKGTTESALMKLITSTIGQGTWSDVGGPGTIDYYPIGMALVVNQTPDVIEQIIQLLESLRQLQDLEVAIEIRLIALSEAFFERIGVDFDLNIDTHSRRIQPNITQNTFQQFPFINNLSVRGATVGLTPAGSLTPDLNIPIRDNSSQLAIPPFGGFQNTPGMDGGISFGLAFLNDIQVFMMLEAAQGDRRFNVMQAPKLTMFNGQTATLNVQDQQFFLTNIQVISVAGQIVFSPQNNPFPLGVTMTLQPVISGDRRFVRITVNQTMSSLASTNVPLFPITTFVTPQFDGGFSGTPVPFTQYVQQPTLSTLQVQTTVSVPDGGTVLLGGLKTLSEGRNEFGPPVLSKIPYLNRLFKNVGYGREAQSLMMMVTPRIIVNRDEEQAQTGYSIPPGYFNQ